MGVAKKVGEADGMIDELAVGIDDALLIGIGNDAGSVVDNLHPFGFRTQNDAGLFEEKSLFLHTATIGHHNARILFEKVDFEECGRRDETDGIGLEEGRVGTFEYLAGAVLQYMRIIK